MVGLKIQSEVASFFEVKHWLKQGDGLNLAMESMYRKLRVDTSGTLLYKTAQLDGYSDDINVFGGATRAVKQVYEDLSGADKEIGLKVNEQKTKVMVEKEM